MRYLTLKYALTVLLACGLAGVTPQYRTWGWEAGHVVSSAFVAVLVMMLLSRLRVAVLCGLHHRRQPPALDRLPGEETHPCARRDQDGAPW